MISPERNYDKIFLVMNTWIRKLFKLWSHIKILFLQLLFVCFCAIYNLFWFLETLKRVTENRQNGRILQKNIFTFGTAKTKCQQRARVFQLIWIDWNLIKMLKKVWFEKAWELTFHSHLKLVSLVKKSMKSCFFRFFWKNAFTLDQISQNFW